MIMKNNLLVLLGLILILPLGCKPAEDCLYCIKRQDIYNNGRLINSRWVVNDTAIFGNSIFYDSTMKITSIIPYEVDELTGVIQDYYESGVIESMSSWQFGSREGPTIKFNKNGSVSSIYNFNNYIPSGNAYLYDSTGYLIQYVNFNEIGHVVFAVNYLDESKLVQGNSIISAQSAVDGKILAINDKIVVNLAIATPPGFYQQAKAFIIDNYNVIIDSISIPLDSKNEAVFETSFNEPGKYIIKVEHILQKYNSNFSYSSEYFLNNILVK